MKAVTSMNSCSVTNALKQFVLCYTFFFFPPTKVVIYNLPNIVLYQLLEVNFISLFWWYGHLIPSTYQKRNKLFLFSPVLSSRYQRAHFIQEKSMHGARYGCPCTLASGWGMLQLLLNPCCQVLLLGKPRCSGIWDFEWSPPRRISVRSLSARTKRHSVWWMISSAQELRETVVSPTC